MATTVSLKSAVTARNQLTKAQAAQLKAVYKTAANDINAKVKQLNAVYKTGNATASQSMQRLQAQQLQKAIANETSVLSKETQATIQKNMEQAAAAGTQAAQAFTEEIGLQVGSSYFAGVAAQAVLQVSTGSVYNEGFGLSDRIWGIDDKLKSDIYQIIAKDMAENKGSFDIAKDIEQYVTPGAAKPWDWSKVYPGTNKVVDYNAQRLARTLVAHAYQQSFKNTWEDNPWVEGYKWIASSSDRTCQLCRDRATNDEYGLGPGVYPKDKLPMDHPNGLCSWAVVITKSLDEIADDIADWYNAPSGTYPAIDKYASKLGAVTKYGTTASKSVWNLTQKAIGVNFDWQNTAWYKMKSTADSETYSAMKKEVHSQAKSLGISDSEYWNGYKSGKYWSNTLDDILGVTADDAAAEAAQVAKQAAKKAATTETSEPFSKSAWSTKLKSQSQSTYEGYCDEWLETVSTKEAKAVTKYTSNAYSEMNTYLRSNGTKSADSVASTYFSSGKQLTSTIDDCQSALAKASLPETTIVRRGSDYNMLTELNVSKSSDAIGQVVTDLGFTSTSPIGTGGFDGAYEYIIEVPQGSQAMYVAPISRYQSEKELLINCNAHYEVVSVEGDGGYGTKIYMRLIGNG